MYTVLRGKLLFISKIALQITFNINLFFKQKQNFEKSYFTYIISEMCMEQALTILGLLKERRCPYKLLEAKKGMSCLGYRNGSYIVLDILCNFTSDSKTNKIVLVRMRQY